MKYYSEKLNKFYNTAVECERAEFAAKEQENREKIQKERELALAKEKKEKALAERKTAAEKVDAARKAMTEAQAAYRKELEAFIDKYGTYHYSTSNPDEIPNLFDWVGNLLRF